MILIILVILNRLCSYLKKSNKNLDKEQTNNAIYVIFLLFLNLFKNINNIKNTIDSTNCIGKYLTLLSIYFMLINELYSIQSPYKGKEPWLLPQPEPEQQKVETPPSSQKKVESKSTGTKKAKASNNTKGTTEKKYGKYGQ